MSHHPDIAGRSYTFTHAVVRIPSRSVVNGLSATDSVPDAALFLDQHLAYTNVLRATGASVTVLPRLERFPDSVFVEDAALCLAGTAIMLRPGAPSRRSEADMLRPELEKIIPGVTQLPGDGYVDGGDLLATDDELFVGLSARTDEAGYEALKVVAEGLGYLVRRMKTPAGILHFKSDCGLLDSKTIFSTRALMNTGCFDGYRVIVAPPGEEAAANIVRFNDCVLVSAGYPATIELLESHGYNVIVVATGEAAKLDGGLSCMSLRYSL